MPPTSRDDFEIAIICALTLEADAVEALFDETYDRFSQRYGKRSSDTNAYVNGRIGRHNVVLCYLPGMGIGSAANVTTNLSFSYSRIQLVLVVGICGAVPFLPTKAEIILGDVIISDSVIQYDFGRQYPDGFRRKSDVKDTLGRPNQEIRSFLAGLKGRKTRRDVQDRICEHLEHLQLQDEIWERPAAESDVLFEASYHHKHHLQAEGATCLCFGNSPNGTLACDEALQKDCDSLGCGGQLVTRQRDQEDATPRIHIGPIACANTVIKSGVHRDKIARSEGIIGFEMEGAGAWDNGPCIIIKGVCDYADSHKNKRWQDYAAATAASCTKSFLKYWTPKTHQRQCSPVLLSDLFHLRDGRLSSLSSSRKRLLSWESDDENRPFKRRGRICDRASNSPSIPRQVQWADIIVLNDALGETFYFSVNLIDSYELFVTVLKHKFEHIGLGKIERGEWMLQDHQTGHVLDLSRHWKTIAKPRRVLDMSMIFRRSFLPDSPDTCPWCKTRYEGPIEGECYIECQNCTGRYQLTRELNQISIPTIPSPPRVEEIQPQSQGVKDKGNDPESHATCSTPPQQEARDISNDIHLYRRVQMVDVVFRMFKLQQTSGTNKDRVVAISADHLEHIERFMEHLAKSSGLSKEECLSSMQGGYGIVRGLWTQSLSFEPSLEEGVELLNKSPSPVTASPGSPRPSSLHDSEERPRDTVNFRIEAAPDLGELSQLQRPLTWAPKLTNLHFDPPIRRDRSMHPGRQFTITPDLHDNNHPTASPMSQISRPEVTTASEPSADPNLRKRPLYTTPMPRVVRPRPPNGLPSDSGHAASGELSPKLPIDFGKPPRKRPRPTKAEIERRKAAAEARGETYPPPRQAFSERESFDPDYYSGRPSLTESSLSHIDGIEVMAGLYYGDGERSQGLSPDVRRGPLLSTTPFEDSVSTNHDHGVQTGASNEAQSVSHNSHTDNGRSVSALDSLGYLSQGNDTAAPKPINQEQKYPGFYDDLGSEWLKFNSPQSYRGKRPLKYTSAMSALPQPNYLSAHSTLPIYELPPQHLDPPGVKSKEMSIQQIQPIYPYYETSILRNLPSSERRKGGKFLDWRPPPDVGPVFDHKWTPSNKR